MSALTVNVDSSDNNDFRPVFSIENEADLAQNLVAVNEASGVTLTIGNLINFVPTPDTVYNVWGMANDVETILNQADISAVSLQITEIQSDGSVVLNLSQALALEAASLPIIVPAHSGDHVTLVDDANALDNLNILQL